MSKKYKNEVCAYCGITPVNGDHTSDHVFSREFFLVNRRDNLPQVPACRRCNKEKSDLEHYLTTVLPFGGHHVDSKSNLSQMVPKRLKGNLKLSREIAKEKRKDYVKCENGLYLPMSTLNFDSIKLEKLNEYIARGLTWFHWKKNSANSQVVTYVAYGDEIEIPIVYTIDNFFKNSYDTEVVESNLGNGAVIYKGVGNKEDYSQSIWEINIYGIKFLDTRKKIAKINNPRIFTIVSE